jgi:hypothetical protein
VFLAYLKLRSNYLEQDGIVLGADTRATSSLVSFFAFCPILFYK